MFLWLVVLSFQSLLEILCEKVLVHFRKPFHSFIYLIMLGERQYEIDDLIAWDPNNFVFK